MSSLILNILLKFEVIFDISSFKNSSDHLSLAASEEQLIGLQIKMHILLIYAKSLKNNFVSKSSFFTKVLNGWQS